MRKALYGLTLATLLSAVLGGSLGYFMRLDLSSVQALEDYRPPQMTRVLAGDGSDIASYATEKRIELHHGEIPGSFRDALIASEDTQFLRHTGVDARGLLRAIWNDVRQLRAAEGASTLTMQLAGGLFLDRSKKTVQRKLHEIVMALEIERRYSKEEILRFYCNQVHMGHGLYGLGAASRFYFDKPAQQLSVGEAAVLVGLLPRPASYSPLVNLELATERRNRVLRRMVEEDLLDAGSARRISGEPIVLASRPPAAGRTTYFTEEVRRWLRQNYGDAEVNGGGLEVRTTLDPRLQALAESAVERGLRQLDKRQGFRRGAVRRLPAGQDAERWAATQRPKPVDGAVVDALVIAVDATQARLRLAEGNTTMQRGGFAWTGQSRADALFEIGEIVRVRVDGFDLSGAPRVLLEQEPEVEAALVALDPATGEVLALVGGFDFSRSEFNRAIQAKRQAGSAFKPFVYATALEQGWSLADTILDEPTVFFDAAGRNPYQPENFSRRYYATVTLRTALEQSINVATVKLLDEVGVDAVIESARRLGIRSPLRPYPSLALGAFEVSLLELTGAYAALANGGLHVEPHWIASVIDPRGRSIHEARPQVTDAVSPQVAYLMSRAMSGVITDGTARAAQALDRIVAGKTGTSDDNTDAWFIGYASGLALGVWVGFDDPRSLGSGETGARAALPIWIEFMRGALAGREEVEFEVPPGIRFAAIDRESGTTAGMTPDCRADLSEAFIEGSEPITSCSEPLRKYLALPYPFQRYPLGADGAIEIPGNEVGELLRRNPGVSLRSEGSRERLHGDETGVELALVRAPDSPTPDLSWIDATLAGTQWVGLDQRPAVLHRWGDGSRRKLRAID